MMVIRRLPDPQGSEGNKIGCQNMEDSRVANGLLIPSLVKLISQTLVGESTREQKRRAGRKESCLILLSLSLNPLSRALDLTLKRQVDLRMEEEMMLLCCLSASE